MPSVSNSWNKMVGAFCFKFFDFAWIECSGVSHLPSTLHSQCSFEVTCHWKFADIRAQFERLQTLGPNYGYFSESSPSILVVAPHNVEQAKVEFAGLDFQIETDSRYLGSFIGEATERDSWIARQLHRWSHEKRLLDRKHSRWLVPIITKIAGVYPQSEYSALRRSIQQEWQLLQRTTTNIESCFDLLEKAMQEEFLPALFGDAIDACTPSSDIFWTGSTKLSVGVDIPSVSSTSAYDMGIYVDRRGIQMGWELWRQGLETQTGFRQGVGWLILLSCTQDHELWRI